MSANAVSESCIVLAVGGRPAGAHSSVQYQRLRAYKSDIAIDNYCEFVAP